MTIVLLPSYSPQVSSGKRKIRPLVLHEIQKVAIDAALHVGARMRSVLQSADGLVVRLKGTVNPVTEVDLWAEKEIEDRVARAFPHHVVLGEERSVELTRARTGEDVLRRGFVWVVDPVDGTCNFANRVPHTAVSIGVLHDGERVAGVVYDPARDELFTAIRGEGARLNGAPIHVSQRSVLVECLVATGFPYDRLQFGARYLPVFEAALMRVRDLRRFGCASLDQCWVACGRLDAFFEFGLWPWDVAAGSLIVEEAGGRVAPFAANGADIFTADSYLSAAPGIFSSLQTILSTAADRVDER